MESICLPLTAALASIKHFKCVLLLFYKKNNDILSSSIFSILNVLPLLPLYIDFLETFYIAIRRKQTPRPRKILRLD
jgi:hypothetical protein